jgi:hypothetical protein
MYEKVEMRDGLYDPQKHLNLLKIKSKDRSILHFGSMTAKRVNQIEQDIKNKAKATGEEEEDELFLISQKWAPAL